MSRQALRRRHLPIRTGARVVAATLKAAAVAEYCIGKEHKGYLVPAVGSIQIDDVRINARDGVAISEVETIRIVAIEDSESVLVDVA